MLLQQHDREKIRVSADIAVSSLMKMMDEEDSRTMYDLLMQTGMTWVLDLLMLQKIIWVSIDKAYTMATCDGVSATTVVH